MALLPRCGYDGCGEGMNARSEPSGSDNVYKVFAVGIWVPGCSESGTRV